MIERVSDWPDAVRAVVKRYESEPFEWGRTDCAHFAFDCAHAMLGHDIMGNFRGAYTGRLSAAARLRHRKYASVADAANAHILAAGGEEIDPRAARPGDIGATQDDILAVRFAPGFIARATDGKFQHVIVSRAWAIGKWPR